MTDRDLLIACYLSGQIPEAAWQKHLRDDPGLEASALAVDQNHGKRIDRHTQSDE